MDSVLPAQIASQFEVHRRNRRRLASRYVAIAGSRSHRILELTQQGFVIEADEWAHLRGFVDIHDGDRLVEQCLVVCVWARDGLVGYEFKRDNSGRHVPADHVAPARSGLLEPPDF